MYYAAAARNTHNGVDSKRPQLLYAVTFVTHEPAQGTPAE